MDILDREVLQKVVTKLTDQDNHIGKQFFPMVEVPSRKLLWDVVMTGEGMVKFRSTHGEAALIQDRSFDTNAATITDMAGKKRFGVDDVRIIREAGEMPVIPENSVVNSMAKRARTKITKAMQRLRTQVDNRIEWACLSALQGELTYTDTTRNISFDVDYKIPSDQKEVTPSTNWDETGSSTPLKDFQTWTETVEDNAGIKPGLAIMSRKALLYLAQSTTLRGYFQYTASPNLSLTKESAEEVIKTELDIDILTYDARYLDGNDPRTDSMERFLAKNKMILLPSMSDIKGGVQFADMPYTPHPHNNYNGDIYVWTDEVKDPWAYEVGIGLTAMPRIYQPRAILTATLW